MTDEQIRALVLETLYGIAPDAAAEPLDPAKSFHDQLEIDSVDFLNLMLSLEERFGFRIPEVDYPKLSSLDGCVAYLGRRVGSDKKAG